MLMPADYEPVWTAIMNLKRLNTNSRARNLVISDLRSETKGSPGSSPAASYVQRWALCSNRPANV